MKKCFVVFASFLALALSSCHSQSEVEKKTADYCEQMIEAMTNNNFHKMMEISDEMAEWKKTLTEEEMKEAMEVSKKYDDEISKATIHMKPFL